MEIKTILNAISDAKKVLTASALLTPFYLFMIGCSSSSTTGAASASGGGTTSASTVLTSDQFVRGVDNAVSLASLDAGLGGTAMAWLVPNSLGGESLGTLAGVAYGNTGGLAIVNTSKTSCTVTLKLPNLPVVGATSGIAFRSDNTSNGNRWEFWADNNSNFGSLQYALISYTAGGPNMADLFNSFTTVPAAGDIIKVVYTTSAMHFSITQGGVTETKDVTSALYSTNTYVGVILSAGTTAGGVVTAGGVDDFIVQDCI